MSLQRRSAGIGPEQGRGVVEFSRLSSRAGFARVMCLATALSIACAHSALAQSAAESDATSSRAARDEALRAIPWQLIPSNEQPLVRSIVQQSSIYRKLPTRVIDCHPAMFTFLVQHPEVVADVWRVMGVSRVKLDKLGPGTYRGNDGAGTTGIVRFVAGNWGPEARNTAVVFADGAYDGKPFVLPLRAKSIILMRSSAVRERNGRYYVTVQADAFIQVDQMAIDLIARTVQPWVNATADRNLVETLTFVSSFSRTAERNPDGMKRMAAKLTAVDEPTRNELVQVCDLAAMRYGEQDRGRPVNPTAVAEWRGRGGR